MESVQHHNVLSTDFHLINTSINTNEKSSNPERSINLSAIPYEFPSFIRLLRLNTRINTKFTDISAFPRWDNNYSYDIEQLKSNSNDLDAQEFDTEKNKTELLKDYIKVREPTRFENIEENHPINNSHKYSDIAAAIFTIAGAISELSELITRSSIFEVFIIAVILSNTVTLALDSLYNIPQYFDTLFLIIYTIECILKIFAAGFIMNHDSYIRDRWNILDISIVITGWINVIGFRLNALRALRILRPLRSISSIRGMKVIFMALVKAAPPLVGTLVTLMFFILVFAIVGLETMMGYFSYRCMDISTGIFQSNEEVCGNIDCDSQMVCAKSLDNPNFSITSFNNIFLSLIIVFECVTLQTWVPLMNIAEQSINYAVAIYFIPISFVGAFLLLNLSLAVIKSAFTRSMEKIHAQRMKQNEDKEEILDYSIISNHQSAIQTEDIGDDLEENIDPKNNLLDLKEGMMSEHSYSRTKKSRSYAFKYSIMPKRNSRAHATRIHDTKLHSTQIRSTQIQKPNWKTQILVERGKRKNTIVLLPAKDVIKKNKQKSINANDSPARKHMQNRRTRHLSRPGPRTTMKGFGKSIFSRELTDLSSLMNESPENSAAIHLGKLQKSIKIRKDIIKKIKKGINVGEIKILLVEDAKTISESESDIIPSYLGSEAIAERKGPIALFKYKTPKIEDEDHFERACRIEHELLFEKYPEMSSRMKLFLYLSSKSDDDAAFHTMMGKALERVNYIKYQDDINDRSEGYWSGFDVDSEINRNEKYSKQLSNLQCSLWSFGIHGYFQKIQFIAKKIESSQNFIIPMMILVFANAFILSLEYYGMSATMEITLMKINLAFTFIFIVEIIVKCVALGIKTFCRDSMNYIDTFIIIFSITELIFNFSSNAVTAFRVLRIFRIIRATKATKIVRYFSFMKSLVYVISYSLPKFIYLACLLMLLNLIYALLGHNIFVGTLANKAEMPRSNFENFGWSFLSVFQVLTLSGYSEVLYDVMDSSAGPWSALFIFSWIVIGNFVLLNLFIAILLDSFLVESNASPSETVTMIEHTITLNQQSLRFNVDERMNKKKEVEKMRILEAINGNDHTSYEPTGRGVSFRDIGCEKSYFLFSKDNKIRLLCHRIIDSSTFNYFIFLIIYLNCITIVWETYTLNYPNDNIQVQLIQAFEIIYAIVYLLEFIMKSISLGLIRDEFSYFSDSWNRMDFVILLISLVEGLSSFFNLGLMKAFRIARAVRALRFISNNSSMKNLVSALVSSIGAIANVVLILFVIWFMFAVVGVSVFAGKLYVCENPNYESEKLCIESGFRWINADYNFDNIMEAFLSLYIVSLLEDWQSIMYDCIDAREIGLSMIRDYNLTASYFFIIFIIVGSFFFLHLFMGVIFLRFHQARKEELSIHSLFLTPEQMFWVEMQKLIVKSSPQKDIIKEPDGAARIFCYKIVTSTIFEGFIVGCINLNMISMAMSYEDASGTYLNALDIINFGFVSIFTIEASMKITAFGFKKYFRSKWNTLEFFVVICAYADIILDTQLNLTNRFIRTGPQVVRIFRIFRLTRLVRIFKPLRSLTNLMAILRHSLSSILNVVSLLLLFLFIFSVIGVFLFSNVTEGKAINNLNNFNTFISAFLVLIRISTGGNWPHFLIDCSAETGRVVASLYFTIYISITIIVILNLFMMVIIQNYEDFESNPVSCLHIFIKDENKFKRNWEKYTKFSHGVKISYKDLFDFMIGLGPRIGFEDSISFNAGVKILSKMAFVIDDDKNIYYHDLLYAVLKRIYGTFPESDEAISNIILRKEESKAIAKIKENRKDDEWHLFMKSHASDEEDNIDIYQRKNTKNLWIELTFTRKVFRGWKNVTRRLKNGELNSSL